MAQDLAAFLGVSPQQAAARLARQPGWVLRRISAASIAALRCRFDSADLAVRVADPGAPMLDLDTRRMDRPAQAALEQALAMIGARPSAALPGYLAASLQESFAAQGLRLVDRAFRNHMVRLIAPPRCPAAGAAGMVLSGRSAEALARASRRDPVALDRGLDCHEAPEAAAAYRAVGLQVDVVPEPFRAVLPPQAPAPANPCSNSAPGAGGPARRPGYAPGGGVPPLSSARPIGRRSGGALAFEGVLQQFDEGAQTVGQGTGPGIDDADLDRLAAPLRQHPDQPSGGNVVAYDIFRKKR